MHAGSRWWRVRSRFPEGRKLERFGLYRRGVIVAGIPSNRLAFGIENFDYHGARLTRFQIVINHCAAGGIVAEASGARMGRGVFIPRFMGIAAEGRKRWARDCATSLVI